MRRNSVQLQRDWEYFNAVALSRSMLRSRMNSAIRPRNDDERIAQWEALCLMEQARREG
jgi:hypothetical protein